MAANSLKPVPFETDLFEGEVLLLVNSKGAENPYNARFEGVDSKYCFEVQVQGKFKVVPPGRMFIGAEITKKMELGIFSRAMCGDRQRGERLHAPLFR
jgi:hypothetical protein